MGFLAFAGQVVSGFVGHSHVIDARQQLKTCAEGSLGECRRRICNHGCVVFVSTGIEERPDQTGEAPLKCPLD